MKNLSIIVAIDIKNGIGKNNQLPWHLPEDMKHFKNITLQTSKQINAVIMGRKTWDSIPEKFRPLPGRKNIIISRNHNLNLPNDVILANSLEDAISKVNKLDINEIFIIGGGQIYKEALNHKNLNKIYLTKVKQDFECDTFLPKINIKTFDEEGLSEEKEHKGINYQFFVYKKNNDFLNST